MGVCTKTAGSTDQCTAKVSTCTQISDSGLAGPPHKKEQKGHSLVKSVLQTEINDDHPCHVQTNHMEWW
mgnify:CR=1 FL=1